MNYDTPSPRQYLNSNPTDFWYLSSFVVTWPSNLGRPAAVTYVAYLLFLLYLFHCAHRYVFVNFVNKRILQTRKVTASDKTTKGSGSISSNYNNQAILIDNYIRLNAIASQSLTKKSLHKPHRENLHKQVCDFVYWKSSSRFAYWLLQNIRQQLNSILVSHISANWEDYKFIGAF